MTRRLIVILVAAIVLALAGTAGAGPRPRLVADLKPGSGSSRVTWLTRVDDRLFFATNGGHTPALWVAGRGGTRVVARSGGGYIGYLSDASGTLYFATSDRTFGNELWTSDGTGAGTHIVRDIA